MFVVLVAVPAITYAMLKNSKVQTFVIQRVAAYISNELQTNVTVGGLDVSFFLNIVLVDVDIEDQRGNPLIKTKRMVFDIGRISFRHRQMFVNKMYLEEAYLGLYRYEGVQENNFQFLIEYFSDNERQEDRPVKRWDVVCKSLELSRSRFSFNDYNHVPAEYGFDKHHFEIEDFKLVVHDMFMENGQLTLNLEQMSLKESGGFDLNYLSGYFSVSSRQASATKVLLRSANSELSLDLSLQYDGFEAFSDFFEKVELSLQLNDSKIDLFDVGYYLNDYYGLQNDVNISGRFLGKASDMKGEDVTLYYGMDTKFMGHFNIKGLPDPEHTQFNFFIHELQTSANDIQGFRIPNASESSHLVLPENISNLDKLSFHGNISGFFYDVAAIGTFQTSLGDFNTNITLKKTNTAAQYSYKGRLNTKSFALGRFFGNDNQLGTVSLDVEIEGEGLRLETMELTVTGNVNSLYLADYEYKNLMVSGSVSNRMFNGSLMIDDQNIAMNFLGIINFEEAIPIFVFEAQIDHANLTALNVYQRSEEAESIVSVLLTINASGGTLDQLEGQLELNDIVYEERYDDQEGEIYSTFYHTQHIGIVNINLPNLSKELFLTSDYIDASLSGQIYYKWLGTAVKNFMATYVPAFFSLNGEEKPSLMTVDENNHGQKLKAEIHFKNTEVLSKLFIPAVELADNSRIYLDFDSRQQLLNVFGQSDMLTLLGNRFVDWNLIGSMTADSYQLTKQCSRLLMSDSLFVDNFCLDGRVYNDTLMYEAAWRSFDTPDINHGQIQGITRFIDKKHAIHRFIPSYVMVNDSKWQINIGNEILFDSARIEVHNLVLYNDVQMVNINGVISADPLDRMRVHFHDFQFSNLDAIIRTPNMNFDGTINGMLSFTALFQPPSFESDLDVRTFAFNHEPLGDLSIRSVYVEPSKAFEIDAAISDQKNPEGEKSLTASGFIYTDNREDHFDIDIQVKKLPLSIWSRYLDGFAQDFHGLANGSLHLAGLSKDPALSGLVEAEKAGFRVDYLKTRYTFSHQVRIEKNYFAFDNLMLVDTLGNSGLASGTIWHNNFKDFSMDIRIRPEQMVVLNTNSSHNELYYGRAYASGLLHIHGNEDDITMDISARTSRGTQVFLPLTFKGEVVENNFITFVSKDTTLTNISLPAVRISGVTLNFDLEVTPDAEVQLIFDSQIGDIIRGRGAGNLKLEISSQGAFNMYGEYIIQEGDYLFTLQNLINKRFRIEQGGSIRWTGDPNDADIDLKAAYRLRTSLYDLMMDVDTTDAYRRRVPVECVLLLEDKLFNPTINFDIQLPGGDESTRELIERRITTEQEMNRQVFSLLILNRFMPTTTDQYNTALGYGVGSTSSELLSNQLSNWLSQISSEFDIGINYRPGDQISSQELEVALSTQLFDDRVLIDGNLGVAGPMSTANQKTSSIIGDVNVEVKITPEGKFRIKAFNRSNTFDIMNTNSPYTQGVGVFYRKEFDSLADLFRRSYRPEEIPEILD